MRQAHTDSQNGDANIQYIKKYKCNTLSSNLLVK